MADSSIGKAAERKIKEWLDRPESGYSFDRIKDQMTGFYGSKNICDFVCFKSPYLYYIESKATWNDRFDFNSISEIQYKGLLQKSTIPYVGGLVIVLFASHKRAFIFDIRQIQRLEEVGIKSLNIKNEPKWKEMIFDKNGDTVSFRYAEIETVPNSRKTLLDYTGELEHYNKLFW